MISEFFDAILFDVGGTLLSEAAPDVAVADLRVEPCGGAEALLHALQRKCRVGIVTNTSLFTESDVRRYLGEAFPGVQFDAVVTSFDVGVEKPDPLPLMTAISRLDVDRSRCVFVGDRLTDEQAATAAGVAFCYTAENIGEALSRFMLSPSQPFGRSLKALTARSISRVAFERAAVRESKLIKPAGSLGRLEEIACNLAAIYHTSDDAIQVFPPGVAVFAADHGVAAGGRVTPWPQSVTAAMVKAIVDGDAAISVLARESGALAEVVDVGVASEIPVASDVGDRSLFQYVNARVGSGSRDLEREAPLTSGEVVAALDAGARCAERLVARGARCLITGEVGIGNTTPAAAVIGRLCGKLAAEVTGRGTGIDDAMLASKTEIVSIAMDRAVQADDAIGVLAAAGGLDIAALAGFILAGASLGTPIVVDGVVTLAALTAANALCGEVLQYCFAGHRSTEPAAQIALDALTMRPLLELDMRLGEGTGAMLAYHVVNAAALTFSEMATLDQLEY